MPVIELVLVLGGALAFGWWQFHEIKRDRAKAAAQRAEVREAEAQDATDTAPPQV